MNLVKVSKDIFREYDIRGIFNDDLTADVAYTIGRSFATFAQINGNNEVIVGHDNRESSPILHDALIQGLLESGAYVVDLGLVTTPMYYFAKLNNHIVNGIMITASHNPKEYNGFKISFDISGNAYGEKIQSFAAFTNNLEFVQKEGNLHVLDIRDNYLNLIKDTVKLGNRKTKVVVDCGNGTGSIIIKEIMKMFDIETYYLYCESDPTFPNHHPDPAVAENMIDIGKKVVELGYDFGFSVDGDADRVGIVDSNGNYMTADLVMLIIYRYLYPTMRHKKAVYDVKCSRSLINGLKDLGLDCTMNRTGNSYLNHKVNQEHYDFGGEYSGHFFFRDRFMGFDDGIYAGLRLVEILSNTSQKIEELLQPLDKYFSTYEEKITVTDVEKFNIVDKVKEYCIEKGYNFVDIDGIRVEFDDGWGLIRASNTGPNITTRYEAKTEEKLSDIASEFNSLINSLKGSIS